MKKIWIMIFLFLFEIHFVSALDMAPPSEEEALVKDTIFSFISSLNQGEETVYTYLASTSDALYTKVQEQLGKMAVSYWIKNITETEEGHYKVDTVIEARGFDNWISWEVHGLSVYFELQKKNGKYVLIKSNLFEKVGSKSVLKMLCRVFSILGCIFLGIVLIILFIIQRRKKKLRMS